MRCACWICMRAFHNAIIHFTWHVTWLLRAGRDSNWTTIVELLKPSVIKMSLAKRSQQTRGIGPMMGWGWASVVDDGPASAQHWANASSLLHINSGSAGFIFQFTITKTVYGGFGWILWGDLVIRINISTIIFKTNLHNFESRFERFALKFALIALYQSFKLKTFRAVNKSEVQVLLHSLLYKKHWETHKHKDSLASLRLKIFSTKSWIRPAKQSHVCTKHAGFWLVHSSSQPNLFSMVADSAHA